MRTTERYIKNDPRHLADAKEAIEDYLVLLNRLTDRELLVPDTSKILPNEDHDLLATDQPEEQFLLADEGFRSGGRHRDRTCDPFHVKEVLSR
jgi:hypothetical protein